MERPRPTFQCDPVKLSEVNASALHLSVLGVQSDQCHYPFGEGPFTFCGLKALPDRSYCEQHYAATHEPWRAARTIRRTKLGAISGQLGAS